MTTKKHLIAAAALLAVGGAAQAQMTLYGLADVCYGKSFLTDLGVFGGTKADVHSGGDNFSSECNSTTRVGIKGAYEVAKGVKANFKFETAGITSRGEVGTDGQPFFNRQAWAGLSGEFGEVRVGRQDSVPFQVMTDFDFNGASNGLSAGAYSGVGAWNTGRQSKSIQYIAPTGGGLTAQLGLVVKGNGGPGAKDVLSGAIKYGAGPILVGAAFESKPATGLKDFTSVAGSYDFGVAKVMASYASGGFTPVGTQAKGYVLGVTAPVAGFTVGAHYGDSKSADNSNLKIKSWEFFINKEVFKNTYGYIEAGNWKGDGGEGQTKANAFAAGVIFVF